MQIRECKISDFEKIHFFNSTALGYGYDLEKTKSRLSVILSRKAVKFMLRVSTMPLWGTYTDVTMNVVTRIR